MYEECEKRVSVIGYITSRVNKVFDDDDDDDDDDDIIPDLSKIRELYTACKVTIFEGPLFAMND